MHLPSSKILVFDGRKLSFRQLLDIDHILTHADHKGDRYVDDEDWSPDQEYVESD
jgi:hypothetical protein